MEFRLSLLTDGKEFVCRGPEASFDAGTAEVATFRVTSGGLVGTHIHRLDPVGEGKEVWHLSAQDIIAIGCLFKEGYLPSEL